MSRRVCEALAGVTRERIAEERRHETERRQIREGEQPHSNVRLETRDVPARIRRREFRVEVDEEIEPDLVCRDALQGVEVLVDVGQLFRLDVEAALLIELSGHADGEAL